MQLADDVTFEIYFEKIGEIKFPKTLLNFFDKPFQKVPKNDDRNRALVVDSFGNSQESRKCF